MRNRDRRPLMSRAPMQFLVNYRTGLVVTAIVLVAAYLLSTAGVRFVHAMNTAGEVWVYSPADYMQAFGLPVDKPMPVELGGTMDGEQASGSASFNQYFIGSNATFKYTAGGITYLKLGVSYHGHRQIIEVPVDEINFDPLKPGETPHLSVHVDKDQWAGTNPCPVVWGSYWLFSPYHWGKDPGLQTTNQYLAGPSKLLRGKNLVVIDLTVTDAQWHQYLGAPPQIQS